MTGDSSLNFKNAVSPDLIQALQTSGFQVGIDNRVNNNGDYYFFAAFGNDPAPGLTTTEAAGTLTVTAPDYFDMTFSTSAGGGVQQFHDLTSGPNNNLDLAGGESVMKALFFDTMAFGGIWYNSAQNDVEPEIDLLEATPTRVKVRQEAFYQREGGTALIAGIKGVGDYAIYPSGRMALRWNRRTTKALTNQVSHVPGPSTPTVIPGAVSVLTGGSDGRLYQLDTASPLPPASVVLGDGTAAVGVPSIDLLNSMVYVGTDQGVIYGVLLPLP